MTFDVVQPTAAGPRVKNDRITGLTSSVPPGNSNTVIKIELKNEPVTNLTTPTPFKIATSSAPAATSSSISQVWSLTQFCTTMALLQFHPALSKTYLAHRITSPPYSIHLGKKCLIPNHSKVKSSQSEVQIGVSIL